MLFYTNLILHQVLNNHSVDDILYCDGMTDKEEKDFATLLIEWYLKQKKAMRESVTPEKREDNAKM